MTLPTSKILKASKSLVAAANIKNQSPSTEQGQQQNVNIVVNSSTPDLRANQNSETKERCMIPNGIDIQSDIPAVYPDGSGSGGNICTERPYGIKLNENPYKNISLRDLADAEQTTEDIKSLISEKDNIIKALSIIVDMYRSNPLMINKYVIPEIETLKELIKLLTNASEVNIELSDIECSCLSSKYSTVKRIYLNVENQVYSLDLCPAVLQFLDQYKISVIMVV